jgi:hypothetical protein
MELTDFEYFCDCAFPKDIQEEIDACCSCAFAFLFASLTFVPKLGTDVADTSSISPSLSTFASRSVLLGGGGACILAFFFQ